MCIGVTLKELSLSTVEKTQKQMEFSSDSEEVETKKKAKNPNYFFDRTLKEFRGKPLHKLLVVQGFAVYI